MRDEEKKPLRSYERRDMLVLDAVHRAMDKIDLRNRIADVPYAKRDIALVKALLTKLEVQLWRRIPNRQLVNLFVNSKHARLQISMKKVDGDPNSENGEWMSFKDMEALVNATRDHCLMCMTKDFRKCPLKLALDNTAVPDEIEPEIDMCPYAYWHAQNPEGYK